MNSKSSYGARYLALASTRERLAFEDAEARRSPFAAMDEVLDRLLLSGLRGERLVDPAPEDEKKTWQLNLNLSHHDRMIVDQHFVPERQQERGAWYLPESRPIDLGAVRLAHWWRTSRRYMLTLAGQEHHVMTRLASTDAMLIWSVLEPTLADLSLPIHIRAGKLAGNEKAAPKQPAQWTAIVLPIYAALGVGEEAIRKFAPATGWEALDADEVMARRDALVTAWTSVELEHVRRLRAYRIVQLVERYYARAKNGRALRKRVMNDRGAERVLSGYFAGDWLAFLAYLGEEPHADEEVTTVLPRQQLLVGASERAASVAAAHGLAPEEVERMLAAYWNQAESESPIAKRVAALGRFWHDFDSIHARQVPGMERLNDLSHSPQRWFSESTLNDAKGLWGTKVLAQFPQPLVTQARPLSAAMVALGPAFEYWHRAGLNAWAICEGGWSQTSLEDFEKFVAKAGAQLTAIGFPTQARMYDELRAAESQARA